jgi:hypothetical protein
MGFGGYEARQTTMWPVRIAHSVFKAAPHLGGLPPPMPPKKDPDDKCNPYWAISTGPMVITCSFGISSASGTNRKVLLNFGRSPLDSRVWDSAELSHSLNVSDRGRNTPKWAHNRSESLCAGLCDPCRICWA